MTINEHSKKVGFINSVWNSLFSLHATLYIDFEGEKNFIFLNAVRLCI